jgi:2-polyprenyl-3-methyl-5-hydroxy-6-metoxy-1,4-benzoquinol methylase
MTDIISPYTEISLYITSIRQQVCPRTSYSTTKTLNLITDNSENIELIKKEIIDEDEFDNFHVSSFEKNTYLNNHVTLIAMLSDNLNIEIKHNKYKEKLQFAENQIKNSHLPLVILLVHNSYFPSMEDKLIKSLHFTISYSQPLGPNNDYYIISLYNTLTSNLEINKDMVCNNNQPHISTRTQFKFLWDNNCNQRILQRIAKTGTIKYSQSEWNDFITGWLSIGLDDFGIYSNIRKYTLGTSIEEDMEIKISNNDTISNTNKSTNDGRSDYMVKMIRECIPSYININSYLDYGCAEGNITISMGKNLKLQSNNIHGADVRSIPNDGFNFIQLNAENKDIPPLPNSILPTIQNNSISIITCSMVMHHVQHPLETFQELRRIIQDNGCLVMREHHCDSTEMATFLDIVHGLYSLSWSNPIEWPNFLDEYEAYYKSQTDWDKIAIDAGFKRVTKKDYHYRINSKLRKDGRISNITKAYYATYLPILF